MKENEPLDGRVLGPRNPDFFDGKRGYCLDLFEKSDCLAILNRTPGINPALALAEGRRHEIPPDGWLIESHIMPSYQGVIDIYRYSADDIFFGAVSGSRRSGSIYLDCELSAFEYELAYENPNSQVEYVLPGYWSVEDIYSEPAAETNYTPLKNGGRLLNPIKPHFVYCGRRSLEWDSVYVQSRRSWTSVNRMVRSLEEVGAVLVSLGGGMGLGESDIRTLVATAGRNLGPGVYN